MEDSRVAHNCAGSLLEEAALTHVAAQDLTAELIRKMGSITVCCWWKLLGEEPNSLCRLLDMSFSELRMILKKCHVLYGPSDSFRTSEFENLMRKTGIDYSVYRPTGKPQHFLKIGDKSDDISAVTKPKEIYSVGGVLEQTPVLGVHLPGIRTKISRRLATKLIQGSVEASTSPKEMKDATDTTSNQSNKGSMSIYINDLVDIVKTEIMYASRQGANYVFTQCAERMLRKAAAVAMKGAFRDLVDAWVERIGKAVPKPEAEECLSTPYETNASISIARAAPTDLNRRLFPPTGGTPLDQGTAAPLITPPVDLTDDVEEEDESDVDIVLSKMKEQTILQNLLHRQVMEKNRVLTLEHRNGRKFLVVLPPDSQTAKAFVADAKKSRWVQQMLCSEVLQRGMLLYMAQYHRDVCICVASQKKITMQSSVLNTPQTIALGRLTGINDTQLKKLRSFLMKVGHAELKYSKKEIQRIDRAVGLHENMPQPTFKTYTLEWSSTSGLGCEKKPPESCSFWNANLMIEVASEVDLLMDAIFAETKDEIKMPPSINYVAPGFDNSPGVTVLFGGDHGAGA